MVNQTQKAISRHWRIGASLATITLVLVTVVAVLAAANPTGASGIYVDSGDCGLRVEASDEFVEVGNLNPGDTKESYVIAENVKAEDLRYFFAIIKTDTERGEYRGETGSSLDEILEFTITRKGENSDDEVLFQGIIDKFEDDYGEDGLPMGTLEGNEEQRIHIAVHLPGAETGNEFQGASVSTQFHFWSDCEEDPDDPRRPRRPRRPPPEIEDPIVLPEPPEPDPEPEKAALNVYKWLDEDQDGVWDEDEEAIEDWVIFINEEEYLTPVVLDDLEPGEYTVREEEREGWVATYQTEVEITLEEGDSKVVLFGNVPEEKVVLPEVPDDPEKPPPPVIDTVDLPRTGEPPPYLFYGAGAGLLLTGLFLERRRCVQRFRWRRIPG